ncbi:Imm6 family immunity protein [Virgibacillus sp. 6R]|uniref:Imm6 family immunity protein n=1 Tax=Metabacillus sp. 22489 TaxID=3453928 RepID=UPI00119D6630
MKNYVENVTNNAKVAIGLAVAEKMFELLNINDNYKEYKIGREALDNCWKWLEGGNIEADDLCNYIDSEDYEDIAEFASSGESTKDIYAWYTALYAVSYTTRQAYRKEEQLPTTNSGKCR